MYICTTKMYICCENWHFGHKSKYLYQQSVTPVRKHPICHATCMYMYIDTVKSRKSFEMEMNQNATLQKKVGRMELSAQKKSDRRKWQNAVFLNWNVARTPKVCRFFDPEILSKSAFSSSLKGDLGWFSMAGWLVDILGADRKPNDFRSFETLRTSNFERFRWRCKPVVVYRSMHFSVHASVTVFAACFHFPTRPFWIFFSNANCSTIVNYHTLWM